MSMPAHKQRPTTPPAPPVPGPNMLDLARRALLETDEQLKALALRRREMLLRGGSDREVHALDSQITEAEHTRQTRSDRVTLLAEQAAREAEAQRAAEHEALLGRLEQQFAARDKIVAELAGHVKAADASLVKLVKANRSLASSFEWPHGTLGAAMLDDGSTLLALAHEIYRAGNRSPVTGTVDMQQVPIFPGAKCGDLNFIALPERSSLPLTEKFAAASAAASRILRSGRNDPIIAPPPAVPIAVPPVQEEPAQASAPAPNAAPVARASVDESVPVSLSIPFERSSKQIELSALLVRQNELASMPEMNAAAEAEYEANGLRIRELSS
jgi:hypothetical protein